MFNNFKKTLAIAVAVVTAGLMLAEASLAGKPIPPSPAPPVFTFMEGKNGVQYIKTVDRNGGNPFTVTSSPDILLGPVRWSPDGLRIGGYRKWNPGATSAYDKSLMSIRSDGTYEQVVVSYEEVDVLNVLNGRPSASEAGTPSGFPFGEADWSPDGRFMVFSAATFYPDNLNEFHLLYVVDLGKDPSDPSRLTQLTLPQGLTRGQQGDRYPHWSWSLNKILFGSSREREDMHKNLWVINPDGSGLRKLMDYDQYGSLYYYAYQAWTRGGTPDPENPDGGRSELCLTATEGLVLVDVDLSQADPIGNITPLAADGACGGFSPDDTGLAVWRYVEQRRGGVSQIVALDLVTGGEQVIVESKSALCAPDWNPWPPTP